MNRMNDRVKPLTGREKEILGLIVAGLSAKEIASLLKIAPRTVESHVNNVRNKTQSRNRAEMAAKAVGMGLVRLRPQTSTA